MKKCDGENNRGCGSKMASELLTQKSATKVRVLVVDDDDKILRFIASSLRLAGYHVFTTTSGEGALQLVESEKPQIMILDILMPQIDGFEVLKRLRAASELPVIAISAHASNVRTALDLGANIFLAKPFRPDELLKKIEALLDHEGQQSSR
jgi:DNA-binding response OmpR family regulator